MLADEPGMLAAGIAGAGALKGLVFLAILLTVGIQGFTAPWLAGRLGLVELEAAEPADAEAARLPTTTD